MKNIHAYTEIAFHTYPGFISINEKESGEFVQITVRSPENGGMSMGSISLTQKQFSDLVDNMKDYVWKRDFRELFVES